MGRPVNIVTKFRADGKGSKTFIDEKDEGLTSGEKASFSLRDYVDVAFTVVMNSCSGNGS